MSCGTRKWRCSYNIEEKLQSTHTSLVCSFQSECALLLRAPKYFPVHEIHKLLSPDQLDTMLAFHALTGCDSVSQFSGHSKKTAWQVFQHHHTDLLGLGKGLLTEDMERSTEAFICRLYCAPEVHACNTARVKLFCAGRTQETATILRCSQIPHHAGTLPSLCMESRSCGISESPSSD